MMLRFSSGSFTLRRARRTASSVRSFAGSSCVGVGGWVGSVISITIATLPVREQVVRGFARSCLKAATLCMAARGLIAQDPARNTPKGWEIVGLPAVNFDSDEGFG